MPIDATSRMTTANMQAARTRLHTALSTRAFMRNTERSMVSPNGKPATWFLDFRSILLDGDVLRDIADLLWNTLKREVPFQVGGLETAAIALVAGVVLAAKNDGVSLTGFYVRKSRKKDGLQRMVEGSPNNEKVVLIDDGLNSGKSFMRQIGLLRLLGKKVHAVCVIVRFRDPSFYRHFEESGIRVLSLFTLDDFPETGGVAAYGRSHTEPQSRPRQAFSALWKFQSEGPVYIHILPKSAPAIDNERVYFGVDNGTFWALNQSDGSIAWSHKTLFGAGTKRIFSSPAVHDGVVYFGSYDGNLYALDAQSGRKRWVFMEADWVGSSPCVAPDLGTVFIGLEFGLWGKRGGIAALDLKTGEKKWWQPVKTMVHSSPAYSVRHRTVIVGSTEGVVSAYDAKDGTLRWTCATGGAVRAGFALDESQGLACFGSADKYIYIVRMKDGKVVHKIETMEIVYSTPSIENGRLYFGLLDKRVMCIDLATGAVEWTFQTSSRVFSGPLFAEGHLYIGGNDGRFTELDPITGVDSGYFQANERIVNKAAYNSATKRFFLPTYANELYCLERIPDSSEHERHDD